MDPQVGISIDTGFDFRKNNFNLIRLLAALQVVLWHGIEHLNIHVDARLLEILNLIPGVPIFFVISGYLISASFERSTSLPNYVWNRFLRIYPALWLCFLFTLLIILCVFKADYTVKQIVLWGGAQLTIGQFYSPEFLSNFGIGVINGSLWTIPVELQFYIILPMVYWFFRKLSWNRWVLSLSVLVLAVANQLYVYQFKGQDLILFKLLGVSVFPYLYMFLVGVILQKNLKFVSKYLYGKAIVWLGVFTVWTVVADLCGLVCQGNYLNPGSAISLGLLTLSCAYSKVSLSKKLVGGWDISYGVYIYHMLIINVLVFYGVESVNGLIILFFGTVAVAAISWACLEKPALSLKRIAFEGSTPKK